MRISNAKHDRAPRQRGVTGRANGDSTLDTVSFPEVRGWPDGRVGRELPEESPGSIGRTAS